MIAEAIRPMPQFSQQSAIDESAVQATACLGERGTRASALPTSSSRSDRGTPSMSTCSVSRVAVALSTSARMTRSALARPAK